MPKKQLNLPNRCKDCAVLPRCGNPFKNGPNCNLYYKKPQMMICPKVLDGSCKFIEDCPDSIEHECNPACASRGYFIRQGVRYDCPACIPYVEPSSPKDKVCEHIWKRHCRDNDCDEVSCTLCGEPYFEPSSPVKPVYCVGDGSCDKCKDGKCLIPSTPCCDQSYEAPQPEQMPQLVDFLDFVSPKVNLERQREADMAWHKADRAGLVEALTNARFVIKNCVDSVKWESTQATLLDMIDSAVKEVGK
jgi:hypothetical protein